MRVTVIVVFANVKIPPRLACVITCSLLLSGQTFSGSFQNSLAGQYGSGASSSRRRDWLSPRLVSDCELGSSCECRVPKFRHCRIATAELARLELPLLDLLA